MLKFFFNWIIVVGSIVLAVDITLMTIGSPYAPKIASVVFLGLSTTFAIWAKTKTES